MAMKQVKVSELSGAALDYAVAVCEGFGDWDDEFQHFTTLYQSWYVKSLYDFFPSSDWSQGGPIIEREEITIACINSEWYATKSGKYDFGPAAPLIAAMRCYVASKLGDVVEIPVELLED